MAITLFLYRHNASPCCGHYGRLREAASCCFLATDTPIGPMSENALGCLLNRAGYHGYHVPHGFRAAFSTIMNEWAERHGKEHDRKVIDLMLAHVPKEKVEGAYNRAAYMPRRRELAKVWADMLTKGLPTPVALVERPSKVTGDHSRRRIPKPVSADFLFPPRVQLA